MQADSLDSESWVRSVPILARITVVWQGDIRTGLGWGDHPLSLPASPSGLESPSHALRADAPPHASSAATICVTLAEGHRCDRVLEILLHPSGERLGQGGQL